MPVSPKRATLSPTARVIKARPDQPEARDEGPRLLPLPERKQNFLEGYSRKYLELADIAMKPPTKPKKIRR
jgi:hypothetical protein